MRSRLDVYASVWFAPDSADSWLLGCKPFRYDPAISFRARGGSSTGVAVPRAASTERFLWHWTAADAEAHIDVSLWYVINGNVRQALDWDHREFASVQWWPMEDLTYADQRFDPHMRRFIEKLRSRIG